MGKAVTSWLSQLENFILYIDDNERVRKGPPGKLIRHLGIREIIEDRNNHLEKPNIGSEAYTRSRDYGYRITSMFDPCCIMPFFFDISEHPSIFVDANTTIFIEEIPVKIYVTLEEG